jgi:hypothetical protein
MPNNLSTGIKGVLLVIGAYIVTIIIAIIIIAISISILIATSVNDCNTVGWIMLSLWIIIAALFLVSLLVVGAITRKLIPSKEGRIAALVALGIPLLVSYFFLAFILLVAFNC